MARIHKPAKKKTAVSIDAKLYDKIVAYADGTERRGGVSGVMEDCVRYWFVSLIEAETPGYVTRLESLNNQLAQLEWKRKAWALQGEYSGQLDEEIESLKNEIGREETELSELEDVQRELNEASIQSKPARKGKVKDDKCKRK